MERDSFLSNKPLLMFAIVAKWFQCDINLISESIWC